MPEWWWRALDVLFPERCRLCQNAGDAAPWVCERCIDASPDAPPAMCAHCGLDVAAASGPHVGPLVWAATRYASDARVGAGVAVRMLKFDGRRALARSLAALVHRRVALHGHQLLVPVPLHATRLRRREFNQAALVAGHLARLLRLPHRPSALRRVRPTPPQTVLNRMDRLRNVEAAFAATCHRVRGRRVLIVDDVCTTGSTIHAAAHSLRAAGASAVTAVVVARRVLLARSPERR